jgi:hypothetical protein
MDLMDLADPLDLTDLMDLTDLTDLMDPADLKISVPWMTEPEMTVAIPDLAVLKIPAPQDRGTVGVVRARSLSAVSASATPIARAAAVVHRGSAQARTTRARGAGRDAGPERLLGV